MVKYYLTNKAVRDLSHIWNFTFDKWSEKQADIYYQMILDNFNLIAQNPKTSKNYYGIMDNLFGYRAVRNIIFYRIINNNKVEITRILHERMDLKLRIKV